MKATSLKVLMAAVLLGAISSQSVMGEQCSTLNPSLCSGHVTTGVTWNCNDGDSVCCKTKDISYTCPPNHNVEYNAKFRWRLAGPGMCGGLDPVTGEPVCISIG